MKKILVVDDNQDILDIVEEVLTYEKFDVRVISAGSDFINEAIVYNPDLVILDFCLGDKNGAELGNEFKALPQFAQTPVILFSAYWSVCPGPGNFGCDDIISKPFDIADLIDKVNQLLVKNAVDRHVVDSYD